MNKYHIRFNHQHNDTEFVWRVFENGKEHLVKEVLINVNTFTETTIEDEQTKWNIACYGNMIIINDIAMINSSHASSSKVQ